MQYPETLPLEDHEVVLTFDDGPLPRNSNQILEILASQCVKATFFTIGRLAQAYPEGVRKLRDAGHTIGTHSQNHPLTHEPHVDRARQAGDRRRDRVGEGGARRRRAPRWRRSFGFPACCAPKPSRTIWPRRASRSGAPIFWPTTGGIFRRRASTISRSSGSRPRARGILLLHDIQARTVAALPRILHELKARGYRIVHVVPATPERPATPTEPQQWQLHPPSENVAISHWPKIPNFVFAEADTLPAPALSSDWRRGEPSDRARRQRARHSAAARGAVAPAIAAGAGNAADPALPVPAESIFEIPEGSFAAIAPAPHRAAPRREPRTQRTRPARVAAAQAGAFPCCRAESRSDAPASSARPA